MPKMGIALQLYTVRVPGAQDMTAALKCVRETGFHYVQWSGMPETPVDAIPRLLADAGLEAMAAHIDVEPFERDYAAQAGAWKAAGIRDLAIGGMMQDCMGSESAWQAGCARLDAVGARFAGDGLRLHYHNHAFELERFPGSAETKLESVYSQTAANHVYAEFDTAWLQVGGVEPAAWLRRYAGRCPVIHVKDVAAEKRDGNPWFTPLGQGVLDWDGILRAAEEAGVEWLVYEQDTCEGDPFDSVAASFSFLNARV